MTLPANVGLGFQSGTRRPLHPFSIRASALAAIRNVCRTVSLSYHPLLASGAYQVSTALVAGRWTSLRRLLAVEFPPKIQMAVLLDERSIALA